MLESIQLKEEQRKKKEEQRLLAEETKVSIGWSHSQEGNS